MTKTCPKGNKAIITYIVFLLAIPMTLLCGCDTGASAPNKNALEVQAGLIIQQALADGSPQVRANAIEVAAGTNERQFMPAIQRLLRDDFVPVRFAAAVAIGDTRYKAAKNDVAQLLKDSDENIRLAAGYATYKLGAARGLEPIRKSITSQDQRARANAAFLLGKTDDKKVLPLLYEAIRDETSDDRVRLNSVEAIARLGDEQIYQKLWAMLISVYADDRVCGIRAMGALGTTQAKDSLLTMLKDNLPEVRLVAAEQLGGLGDTAGEKDVLDALTQGISAAQDQEGRERIQTLAALAIGQIRTPALKKFLPELLKNESHFVRLAAANAVFKSAAGDNIGR